jgi:A/G-specific adenine glycosylase
MERANFFTESLLDWHRALNQREMPWKEEKDPYKIWLSEIILQQTRVEQGKKYYHRFLDHFPGVEDLAAASLDQVLQLWEGLGYYSRARNLWATANTVVKEYKGKFPESYAGLLQLKGIGPYTASAIGSFAYGLPLPVVDSNSLRLVTRFQAHKQPIDQASGKNYVQSFLENALPQKQAAQFNQAIMDFGATVCRPRSPHCPKCPLRSECKAHAIDQVHAFPQKKKTITKKQRHFHYYWIEQKGQIVLQKRRDNDIWKGLYQLPLLERPGSLPPASPEIAKFLGTEKRIKVQFLSKSTQMLTHRYIHGYFYRCTPLSTMKLPGTFQWVPKDKLKKYGLPKIVRSFLLKQYAY